MRSGAIAALLVAAVIGTAGIEYLALSPYGTNQVTVTTTTTQAFQSNVPIYDTSNVSIAVGCCPSLPPEFIVGNHTSNTYVFDVTYGPIYPAGSGTIVSGTNMSVRANLMTTAHPPSTMPVVYQWANFTIYGTFGPSVLDHRSASLFDGAVFLRFYVYQSILYLQVTTR